LIPETASQLKIQIIDHRNSVRRSRAQQDGNRFGERLNGFHFFRYFNFSSNINA
jgi:hypothetical protein